MSNPKPTRKILGPNSSDSPIIEIGPEDWDTKPLPLREFIEALRAEARKRAGHPAPPPKENGEPGNS